MKVCRVFLHTFLKYSNIFILFLTTILISNLWIVAYQNIVVYHLSNLWKEKWCKPLTPTHLKPSFRLRLNISCHKSDISPTYQIREKRAICQNKVLRLILGNLNLYSHLIDAMELELGSRIRPWYKEAPHMIVMARCGFAARLGKFLRSSNHYVSLKI